MAKRKIITIDQELCNGCGNCIPGCPEGAIQMIDSKARLISDMFCDGLGACLGECPVNAITIEEREAEEYNEKIVMANIAKQGANTIKAHLMHLEDHGETAYLKEAVEYLEENNIPVPNLKEEENFMHMQHGGCPGSKVMDFSDKKETQNQNDDGGQRPSQLKQWPVQLHLVPPTAPYYQGRDVVLIADCVGYAMGDLHKDFMKDKAIAIACPKLDSSQEVYLEKLTSMINNAKINTLTVLIMEVPCCHGLLALAQRAASQADRKIPIKSIVVSIQGDIIEENWV